VFDDKSGMSSNVYWPSRYFERLDGELSGKSSRKYVYITLLQHTSLPP
jgi:hypothetical protein